MTDKAKAVIRKRWRQFQRQKVRDRALKEFNQSTLDDVRPIGGEQRMRVMQEMNSLGDEHDGIVKSLTPQTNVD